MYSKYDVMEYVSSEDVKFIRLAFCDLFGNQKNISILPDELKRAFETGISFDASAIRGFEMGVKSDLLLFPDPSTLVVLPWRPTHGRVVRMFCDIKYPDGRPFERDSRHILKEAIKYAKSKGISCDFGSEFKFYLFNTDENGNSTKIPFDNAGYMDIAPDDKGENVRREICLTLEGMGIIPETSHHEEGPGQNEIDFRYSNALFAADNALTFKSVVKTIASKNGLCASFEPKPLQNENGNSMHINISINNKEYINRFIAGVLKNIKDITLFLNPSEESYLRLGEKRSPAFISWSYENRSQLVRIPADCIERARFELRSPDPMANPYIAYALLIYAGIDGISSNLELSPACNEDLSNATDNSDKYERLPLCLDEALRLAKNSDFVNRYLPKGICDVLYPTK